jgi:hypothetical protein
MNLAEVGGGRDQGPHTFENISCFNVFLRPQIGEFGGGPNVGTTQATYFRSKVFTCAFYVAMWRLGFYQ